MPQYFPQGFTYLPGLVFDEAQSFGIGISSSTTLTWVLVAAPNSTGAVEVLTLTSGGTFTAPSAITFSTGVTISTGAFALGPSAQNVTGIRRISLSTYSPAALAASTGRLDLIPSTTLTLTTSDLLFYNLPSSYASTGAGIVGCFPTSSGGFGMSWVNATTASITPSTGAYTFVVMRTT